MSKINHYTQPIALLNDLLANGCQTAHVVATVVRIAQSRNQVISIVKQLQVAQPALVDLFHPFQFPFNEL